MKSLRYLFLVPVAMNLAGQLAGLRALTLISKPLLMPLIALSVLILLKEHDVRDRRVGLIVAALLLGAVGDVLLMLEGTGCFLAGMGAFFLGHIFYFSVIPAPWKVKGLSGKFLSALFLAALLAFVITLAGRFPLQGPMRVAVTVYACAFAFLIHAGVVAAVDRRRPFYLLTVLGFAVFAVSDTFVAIGAFTDLAVPQRGFIVMSTYIAAQLTVAFSLALEEIDSLEKTEYGVRAKRLYALEDALKAREDDLVKAFDEDFGKGAFEVYTTEVGFLYNNIRNILTHLRDWMRPKAVPTPFVLWPGRSRIMFEPYGKVLVIGPFNYPLHLVVAPLAAALAAGNTVVVKPSRQTPNVSRVLSEALREAFDPEVVEIVDPAMSNEEMLARRYDYIFFTGSPKVGKVVMEAASKHLTPVTLELGGKSPAIVCEGAPARLACERIAKGKFLNAGQTCVAPDYVLVHESVHDEFISTMRDVVKEFFGDISVRPAEMTLMATGRHFDRVAALIPGVQASGAAPAGTDTASLGTLRGGTGAEHGEASGGAERSEASCRSGSAPEATAPDSLCEAEARGEVVIGGYTDAEKRYIAPTVIDNCTWDAPAMREEIFGPVLPVITYKDLQTEVIDKVKDGEKPLSLYIFSRNRRETRSILSQVSFGGGCVNETMMHLGNENLPFGGVGESGMGAYHGKTGFETFSHQKSLLLKSSWLNIDLLKPPYGRKLDLIRKFYK
ncbi:MAG: aldehyde dehydrogenase family protein [Bacteroidales bacterium]|nr:aldehyde dehydrogenase family protein [Bacteroidales bacterium]